MDTLDLNKVLFSLDAKERDEVDACFSELSMKFSTALGLFMIENDITVEALGERLGVSHDQAKSLLSRNLNLSLRDIALLQSRIGFTAVKVVMP